jgi:Yip1 domain
MHLDLNLIVARIKNILLETDQEWDAIQREETTVADIYKRYLMAAAAVPAFAHLVGQIIGIHSVLPVTQLPLTVTKAVFRVVIFYGLWLGSVHVTAFLINQLAPTFRSKPDRVNAVKLAGFAWIAVWAVGLLLAVPILRQLLVLALFYAIYILHLGLPKLMGTPHDRTIPFTVVIAVAMFVLFIVTGWFGGSL